MRKKFRLLGLVPFFLIVLIAPEKVLANGQEPKSLRIFPEVESGWFLDGELEFGCEVTYANGGKRRSTGYLNGNIPWNQFIVTSDQAAAYGDRLLIDLFKVRSNQQTLVIKVRLKDSPHVESVFDLKIPPMESVSIFLSNRDNLSPGKKVKPRIAIEWANYFRTEYSLCNRKAPFPLDSVQLFLNKERVFDCRVMVPESIDASTQMLSLSVIWASKQWINDTEIYWYTHPRRKNGSSLFQHRKSPFASAD